MRAAIEARAQQRVLQPGERLYSRGEQSDGMFGVIEGSIRVSIVSPGGVQIVLDFYGPGSWFGEVSTLDEMPRNHDAEAHIPTTLLQLSPADAEELIASYPAFGRALLRLEAQRLRILLTALGLYSTHSLEHRLANRLLMLAGSYGVPGDQGQKIELHLPQETLAQLIGSTRQRVNQILKTWEKRGIVQQHYGHLVLLNQARLEAIAQ
jgi:CRP-like cAMP-binding protein